MPGFAHTIKKYQQIQWWVGIFIQLISKYTRSLFSASVPHIQTSFNQIKASSTTCLGSFAYITYSKNIVENATRCYYIGYFFSLPTKSNTRQLIRIHWNHICSSRQCVDPKYRKYMTYTQQYNFWRQGYFNHTFHTAKDFRMGIRTKSVCPHNMPEARSKNVSIPRRYQWETRQKLQ